MNQDSNMPAWLLSSTGEGLALRVKSFLVGVVPTVLVVAPLLGVHILPADLNQFVDLTVEAISGLVSVVSICYFVVGWLRNRDYKAAGLGKYAR